MAASGRTLKILMLHGFTQSATHFARKTQHLQTALSQAIPASPALGSLPEYSGGVELVYLEGPIRLTPADLQRYRPETFQGATFDLHSWWRWELSKGITEVDATWQTLSNVLATQGPFAGVIGFSQGAALGIALASLLEPGRAAAMLQTPGSMPYPSGLLHASGDPVHPPLRFVVAYSGFTAPNTSWKGLYEPRVRTPVLNVAGAVDEVIKPEAASKLVQLLTAPQGEPQTLTTLHHSSGHLIPTGQDEMETVMEFVSTYASRPWDHLSIEDVKSKL